MDRRTRPDRTVAVLADIGADGLRLEPPNLAAARRIQIDAPHIAQEIAAVDVAHGGVGRHVSQLAQMRQAQ